MVSAEVKGSTVDQIRSFSELAKAGNEEARREGLRGFMKSHWRGYARQHKDLVGMDEVMASIDEMVDGFSDAEVHRSADFIMKATPRTMQSSRFMVNFHGTPHTLGQEEGFPHGRFHLDKIGTGEGAQAFGWGIYFAGKKGVARSYKEYLSKFSNAVDVQGVDSISNEDMRGFVEENIARIFKATTGGDSVRLLSDIGLDLKLSKRKMASLLKYTAGSESDTAKAEALIEASKLVKKGAITFSRSEGSLYQLDIPDSAETLLIDWDKPLEDQSKDVLAKIRKALPDVAVALDEGGTLDFKEVLDNAGEMGMSHKDISEALQKVGIPGLRFLDGASRADGEGTHNTVIWDQKVLDQIVLMKRNEESLDATIEEIKLSINREVNPEIASLDVEYLDAAKNNPERAQEMVDEAAKKAGYKTKAYHGTTHGSLKKFDPSKSGNKEGFLGAVNYFTSEEGDAEENYLSGGADLTNRIEQRSEQMQNEDIDMSAEEVSVLLGKSVEELVAEEVLDSDGDILDVESVATAIATRDLSGSDEAVLPVYIKTENPATVQAERKRASAGFQFLHFTGNQRIDLQGDEELIISAVREAVENNTEDDVDAVMNELFEALPEITLDGETTVGDLMNALKNNESLGYAEDYESGELVSSHIIGEVFKNLGYDSIILENAEKAFPNMNMPYGTTHTHVFGSNPEQIKSADAITRDADGNVIPLSQRFDSAKSDIRFSVNKEIENMAQDAEESGAGEVKPTLMTDVVNLMYDRLEHSTSVRNRMHRYMSIARAVEAENPKVEDRDTFIRSLAKKGHANKIDGVGRDSVNDYLKMLKKPTAEEAYEEMKALTTARRAKKNKPGDVEVDRFKPVSRERTRLLPTEVNEVYKGIPKRYKDNVDYKKYLDRSISKMSDPLPEGFDARNWVIESLHEDASQQFNYAKDGGNGFSRALSKTARKAAEAMGSVRHRFAQMAIDTGNESIYRMSQHLLDGESRATTEVVDIMERITLCGS